MNLWRIVLVVCMLILVFYAIFTALHDYNRMNTYCSAVCESFDEEPQGIQGSYCICENTYLLAYDFEAFNQKIKEKG